MSFGRHIKFNIFLIKFITKVKKSIKKKFKY